MAEWIAQGEPSLDLWHMDIRRFGTQYRSPSYTHARVKETYETYYDIRYPNHEREAGRPLRVSPANRWHSEHEAATAKRAGSGSTGTSRCRGRRRVAAPPRLGRPALVAGDRRRAPRLPRAAAIFDESSSRTGHLGPGRGGAARAPCDTQVAAASGRSPTPRCEPPRRDRVRLHRHQARRGALLDRHRHRVRQPRPRVDPPQRAHRGLGEQVEDVTPRFACVGIWGPKAREILQPLTPDDLSNEAFPYMNIREITIGHVPVRALRVTYRRAGLGALPPHRVRARPLADAAGGRRATALSPPITAHRLDAPREGLPRVGRRHHARRAPYQAASASA